MDDGRSPELTRVNPLAERLSCWTSGSARGQAVGRWISRTLALPQLRRLTGGVIPWTQLRRPITEATVALVTTSGVHLRRDKPFNPGSDSSFRVIPCDAEPGDLAITHQAYDRRDALRDINLVFPLQRLRELAAQGVIGRLAAENYGFGLVDQGAKLIGPGREVAARLNDGGVDLALLVPA
ncbi:MAG TPA: glycine/sarcosine/betaine reductase selenoprotein B family protein [Streptosporangiaceae bacterium]|nr:glycine/sarcosine/betaine reductase selenoprotein B family protein [Streptosporangiaceae bacterium]